MSFSLLVVSLLVVGVVLLLIEVFTPGFGVVGGMGVVLTLAGIVVAFARLGWLQGLLSVVAALAVTAFIVWYFPRSRAAKALVLSESQQGRAADASLMELVGKQGVAATPLRPSGTMRLPDRVVDVVAEGVYVEAGTAVRVSRVEGTRVVVEPVPEYSGEKANG
jgi:membrane-bound serine protease (ClpP class)